MSAGETGLRDGNRFRARSVFARVPDPAQLRDIGTTFDVEWD